MELESCVLGVLTNDAHIFLTITRRFYTTFNEMELHIFNRITRAWAPPIPFPCEKTYCAVYDFKLVGVVGQRSFSAHYKMNTGLLLQVFSLSEDLSSMTATKRLWLCRIAFDDMRCINFFPNAEPARAAFFIERPSGTFLTLMECGRRPTEQLSMNFDAFDATEVLLTMFFNDELYVLCQKGYGVKLYLCSDQELQLVTANERCYAPAELVETMGLDGSVRCADQACSSGSTLVIYVKFDCWPPECHSYDITTGKWLSRTINSAWMVAGVHDFSFTPNEVIVFVDSLSQHENYDHISFGPRKKQLEWDWPESCSVGIVSVWTFAPTLSDIALRTVQWEMPKATAAKLSRETSIVNTQQLVRFLYSTHDHP